MPDKKTWAFVIFALLLTVLMILGTVHLANRYYIDPSNYIISQLTTNKG